MNESIPKHLANLTSVSSDLFLNMLQFELLKVVDEFRPALLKLLRRLRRLYAPGQGLFYWHVFVVLSFFHQDGCVWKLF